MTAALKVAALEEQLGLLTVVLKVWSRADLLTAELKVAALEDQ